MEQLVVLIIIAGIIGSLLVNMYWLFLLIALVSGIYVIYHFHEEKK